MCLTTKFLNSSVIRNKLENYNLNTLNSRLDRLTKQQLIEKSNISGKLKPGGDKIKYKITKQGNNLKKDLIEQAKKIILIDSSVKKTLLKEALKEDDNIITNIISEYSHELKGYLEGKELKKKKKKLTTIINKNIGVI